MYWIRSVTNTRMNFSLSLGQDVNDLFILLIKNSVTKLSTLRDIISKLIYSIANLTDCYLSIMKGFLNSSTNKKKGALIIILSISSGMLLLSAVVYVCAIKKKRPHMKKRGNEKYVNLFSFYKLNSMCLHKRS